MTVSWQAPQPTPIDWATFLEIEPDIRRDLEIVDGFVVPREQRGRDHQKVGTRLSLALERVAVAEMRGSGGGSCYETNTEVDVLLWEVPPTARKPDAVLHRCLPDTEQLTAEHCVIVVEVLSTWSERRDRVHKMSDYADAGIPHYWLVSFDKVGALTIERYALSDRRGPYTHVGTTHRDMGSVAVTVTDPFPLELLWSELEIAPPV
ncbi:Uma2 family endonuclease [Nocardia bovistercoris]|uniref:Uma2 family endonuclease n=1 Tax=Nocardia bovistercoris TaxID=2785916 RepID=A0A931N1P2_9NOCA|nr:Uma2 family endonuclease [Nocardia bovistercoris]